MTPARGTNEAFAHCFVDELWRSGVRHAFVAPGSRSGPLALALHRSEIEVHVHVDERSAAFLALGVGRATGTPAVVVCTSGTAPAHLYPAIVEARHDRVPLLAVSADRPPELRATGANQTIDQVKMFGDAVLWFADSGLPDEAPGSPRYWRSLACRAFAEATGTPTGPVHVNVPLREPLYPEVSSPSYPHPLEGRDGDRPWTTATRSSRRASDEVVEELGEILGTVGHGLVVAGASHADLSSLATLSDAIGWPLLAEPSSNARLPGAIAAYDSLLRSESFLANHRPDVVLRVGKLGLGRPLGRVLRDVRQIAIDPDGAWLDEHRNVELLVTGDVTDVVDRVLAIPREKPATSSEWEAAWRRAEVAAQDAIDRVLDAERDLSEPGAARAVEAAIPDGSNLFVASSMPVRDLESFMQPRTGIRVHANRGTNGIDGSVSTPLGIALATRRPTYALLGDLALLHDSNGFLLADRADIDVTFVVVNNDGGGIFSFLEQARVDGFEELFGTPHGRDLEALARFHDIGFHRTRSRDELGKLLREPDSVRLIEVPTERRANVELHRGIWAAVEDAL